VFDRREEVRWGGPPRIRLDARVAHTRKTHLFGVGGGAVNTRRRTVRLIGAAAAWPVPLTADDTNFLNAARRSGFPGGDDQLLLGVGRCAACSTPASSPQR
jgi:hypothetical protein